MDGARNYLMYFLSKSIGVPERQGYKKVHFQMLVSIENLVLFCVIFIEI